MPLENERETPRSHQGELAIKQYDWHECSPDTIHHCVKASIHALKLHHDRLEGHTTRWWRRSECRRNGRSRRSCHLGLWPLRSKLGLIPSNDSSIYGTYRREVCRLRIGDRKMTENPCDSQRENELITGHCIPINIYKGEYKVRGKINSESLKKR